MKRNIWHAFALLVVIVLVSGITYLIFNNASVRTGEGRGTGQGSGQGQGRRIYSGRSPTDDNALKGSGQGQGYGHEEGSGNAQGIWRNLALIMGVTLIIVLIDLIIDFTGKKKKRAATTG